MAYGVMTSIFSYACARYAGGERVLQWAIIATYVMSPLATAATNWVRFTRLWLLCGVCAVCCVYVVLAAFLPTPPALEQAWLHSALAVGASVVFTLANLYAATMGFVVIADIDAQPHLAPLLARMTALQRRVFAELGSRYCGGAVEVGSLLGAVFIFALARAL